MMITSMVDLHVDLAALEHNYRQLRLLCDPQVKMLAVVKADAYGHGLLPVARTLARAGVDYLGVGSLEEGLALRQAGLTLPVLLLLGILPQEAERAVAARPGGSPLPAGCGPGPGGRGPESGEKGQGAPQGGHRHGPPGPASRGGSAVSGRPPGIPPIGGLGAHLPPGRGGRGG